MAGRCESGGPILRDRLFFFGTYEGNHITFGETVVPLNVDPLRAINPMLADQLASKAGTFDRPVRSNLYFGKLTYVPGAGSPHLFELSTSIRDEYDIRDFGNQNARETATLLRNDVNTVAAKYQFARSSVLNELSASFQRYQWNPSADGDAGFNDVYQVNGRTTCRSALVRARPTARTATWTARAANDWPEGEGRNWWRPERHSFIFRDAWTYRNVDLRLEKRFRTFRNQEVGVIAEVFNIFDYANFTGYNLNYGSFVVQSGQTSIVRTTVCPVVTTAGQAPVDPVPALGRTTGVITDLRRLGAPRRYQLGLRYQF